MDAKKAPLSEPMPPTTTTTKIIAPTEPAIAGSVIKVFPPTTPASPASAAPPPNTSMKTRGTLCPSASAASGCVRAAWITKPIRVRVSSSQMPASMASEINMMKARDLGKLVPNTVNSGPCKPVGST